MVHASNNKQIPIAEFQCLEIRAPAPPTCEGHRLPRGSIIGALPHVVLVAAIVPTQDKHCSRGEAKCLVDIGHSSLHSAQIIPKDRFMSNWTHMFCSLSRVFGKGMETQYSTNRIPVTFIELYRVESRSVENIWFQLSMLSTLISWWSLVATFSVPSAGSISLSRLVFVD